MTKSDKYVPKHRAPGKHKAVRTAPRQALRTSLLLTGVAAAATGLAVSNGILGAPSGTTAADLSAAAAQGSDTVESNGLLERRAQAGVVSRSDRRGATDARKVAALSAGNGPAITRTEDLSSADPRDIARALLPEFGFDESQFSCLDSLYVSESDWRVDADNPTSSAYGIPQALTQLHDLPADYMTSAESQIRWGLGYIQDTYGTPCSAWSFKQGNNWY
ncbi:lytic transglycosylase domain-containing protein [Nocardioides sp.]|uniref:aggregation-promoting factor C-terminal-like domain-containing protein n=1 Tax=Nocardioides sp. TaxID=35761 RepID=UPI002B79C231|nr:lytic transglycosylase domain-containing protein [Nocardioides sp.]HXH77648.1 lytic transglycosylase domain-containing protein [Nocardioides sp.]